MEYKDYYQALGVKRDSTADEIKRAYRKLAKKYHPDVSKEPDAATRMQELNEAWAVLSDAEKRAAYDNLGSNFRAGQNFRPPPGWDGDFGFSNRSSRSTHFDGAGGDFSDFFSSLFGDVRARHQQQHQQFRQNLRSRGSDQRAKVTIELADSLNGGERTITLQTAIPAANGQTTLQTRNLSVKIPKGIKAGQQIRLSGQGTSGANGGKNGDLLLEIQFKPDPRFRVEGQDIYISVPVTPWELALGASIKVMTPSGEVEVRIPENSGNGRKLRLKERGLPGAPSGDLYLVLEVELPPANTPKARELYETMARELAFNPRQK